MTTFRNYTEKDSEKVGLLIADPYAEFTLAFASPEDQALMLGPLRHAHSTDEQHRQAIVRILESPVFLVAEVDGEIAGCCSAGPSALPACLSPKNITARGLLVA